MPSTKEKGWAETRVSDTLFRGSDGRRGGAELSSGAHRGPTGDRSPGSGVSWSREGEPKEGKAGGRLKAATGPRVLGRPSWETGSTRRRTRE